MQEKYIGRLLEDGHLSIPKEIVEKLKIDQDSAIHVIVQVRGQSQKKKIMSYAGLLSDLSEEEEKQFDEAIKRSNLFEKGKAEP
jgi:hypothetical protein